MPRVAGVVEHGDGDRLAVDRRGVGDPFRRDDVLGAANHFVAARVGLNELAHAVHRLDESHPQAEIVPPGELQRGLARRRFEPGTPRDQRHAKVVAGVDLDRPPFAQQQLIVRAEPVEPLGESRAADALVLERAVHLAAHLVRRRLLPEVQLVDADGDTSRRGGAGGRAARRGGLGARRACRAASRTA